MAVQISGNDITVPRDGSFTRNVTIGGTLTYEDVTNIDSVGLVTARTGIEIGARPGVAASISVDGNMIVSGISTFGGVVNASSDIKVGSGVTIGKDGDIFATGITTMNQIKITTGANAFETSANVFKGASGQKGVYLRSALSAEDTPSYSSVDDTNTGIFLPGSDVFGVTTGGSERLRIDGGGNLSVGVNTNPGGNRLLITDSHTEAFVNPTDSILRITNSNSSADTNQASICFTCSTTGSGADSAIVSQADDSSGNSRLEFWTDTNNGMTEKLSIRGSDGRVTITNDLEFSTSGTGGLFGKFAVTNQTYTANSNLDIAIGSGNYIFSVRSGGVYHYNAIFMVTYYDSADKNSTEILHGDYGTTATHTVIHNSNNNGTFRLTFNRNFDGLNVRQLKLS